MQVTRTQVSTRTLETENPLTRRLALTVMEPNRLAAKGNCVVIELIRYYYIKRNNCLHAGSNETAGCYSRASQKSTSTQLAPTMQVEVSTMQVTRNLYQNTLPAPQFGCDTGIVNIETA